MPGTGYNQAEEEAEAAAATLPGATRALPGPTRAEAQAKAKAAKTKPAKEAEAKAPVAEVAAPVATTQAAPPSRLTIQVPTSGPSQLPSVGTPPPGGPSGQSGQSRGRASSVNSKGRSRSPSPSGKTKERTDGLISAVAQAKQAGNYALRALRHGACTDSWHDFHNQAYNETDTPQNGTFGLFDTLQGLPALTSGEPFPLSAKNPSNDSLHDENEIMMNTKQNIIQISLLYIYSSIYTGAA